MIKILKLLPFGIFLLPFLFRLDTVQLKPSDALVLKNGTEVKQYFTPKHNGLYLIKIFAKNPKLIYQGPIKIRLNQSAGETLVSEMNLMGLNIGDDVWVRFQFAPQNESLGKEYYFSLSVPIEASSSSYVSLLVSKDRSLGVGNTVINHGRQNESLMFKTYYKTSLLQYVSDVTADFINRIQNDLPFITVYVILLLSVAVGVIYFAIND